MKVPPLVPPARRANNRFATLALLALLPGLVVLGWRAALAAVGVIAIASLVERALREPRLGVHRWPILLPVDAILLAGLLPAEVAGGTLGDGWRGHLWPIVPIGGVALALLRRLRELTPWPPFDAIVVVALALHVLVGSESMSPRSTLRRGETITGDVLRSDPSPPAATPWFKQPLTDAEPATRAPWATRNLDAYLALDVSPTQRVGTNLDSLIRDRLPPLEDLVLLGHPMPIGMCSGIVLLGVILWGAHRRTIDYRVPLASILTAYVALVVLPVPASIGDRGASWRLFASLHADVGLATALTFAHYLLFASPLLYCLGLLATRGDVRPLQPRAVLVWSILLGAASAVSILYYSVMVGPLVVLLVAPVVGRWLDRVLARRPLALPA